jgi:chromosome segregation ATPase
VLRTLWKKEGSRSLCNLLLKEVFKLSEDEYREVVKSIESGQGLAGMYQNNEDADSYVLAIELPRSNWGKVVGGTAAALVLGAGGLYAAKRRAEPKAQPFKKEESELEGRKGEMDDELRQLEEKLQALRGNVTDTDATKATKDGELQQLERRLEALRVNVRDMDQTLDEKKAECGRVDAQLVKKKKEYADFQVLYENDMKDCDIILSKVEENIERKRDEYGKLVADIEQKRAKFDADIEQKRAEFETDKSEMGKVMEAQLLESESLAAELAETERLIGVRLEELGEKDQKLVKLREQTKKTIEENSGWLGEIANKKEEVKHLERQLTAMYRGGKTFDDIASEYQKLNHRNTLLTEDISNLKYQRNQLKGEISELRQTLREETQRAPRYRQAARPQEPVTSSIITPRRLLSLDEVRQKESEARKAQELETVNRVLRGFT